MEENRVLELTISSTALRQAVAIAGAVVQSNAIVPIMEELLFVVQDSGKRLQVTGSGSSITVVTDCEFAGIEQDDFDKNSFTMPYASLYALLKELPETPLTLSYYYDRLALTDSYKVVIQENGNEYEFATQDPFAFIKLVKKEGESFVMDADQVHFGLKYVKSCMGTNQDLVPWMFCAYMDFNAEGRVKFVATDGQKIAVIESNNVLDGGYSVTPFMLNPKLVGFVDAQLTERSTGPVTITRTPEVITMEYDNFTVIASAMIGDFPPYMQIVEAPNDFTTSVVLENFKSTIRRTLIFADTTTVVAVMEFAKNLLFVTSEDNLYGKKAKQHVILNEEVDPFAVAVSGKALREVTTYFVGDADINFSNTSRNLSFVPKTHNVHSVTLLLGTLQFNANGGIKKKN